MRLALALVALLGLSLAVTSNAAVKPKPWQWTPAKAASAVRAQGSEIMPTDSGFATLTNLACRGHGVRVAGRFTAFRCNATFTASTTVRATLTARTRKAGGLCWTTLTTVPSGCLAPGPRARGSVSTAYGAWRMAHPGVSPVSSGCRAHGAGFYSCWLTSSQGESRGVVVFGPSPTVRILSS